MASRHIAPAPAPVGNAKLTPAPAERARPNIPRGKQDISISEAGILNPESISKAPKSKARAPKKAVQPAEFGFVNISNPSQASSRQHKSFVKSFVRQQTVKQDRNAKSIHQKPEQIHSAKPATPPSLQFVEGSNFEIRPAYLLDTVPRKIAIPRNRQIKRTQVLLNSAASETILGLYHGGTEITAGWELFRLWNGRYPKATYAEILRMIGNDVTRLEWNPYQSNIVYPVPLDNDSKELVKFLHCDIDVTKLRLAFRPVWFSLFMKDSAAFIGMMAAAMAHRDYTHGLNNNAKFKFLRQQAWMSVNDRLADPVQCTTDGVLAAILSFLILDYSMKQMDQYVIAKAGLVRLVNMRGGISALEHNSELRLTILWDDVGSSTAFDIEPRFGLPLYHLPPLPYKSPIRPSQRLLQLISSWSSVSPKMTTLLHDLFILNSLIIEQGPKSYEDPLFMGLQINPIVMRLLMAASSTTSPSIEKICATAAIIYMGDVRVKYCTYHLMGYHFIPRLRKFVDAHGFDWGIFEDWKLWVLVVGGMKAVSEDREYFIRGVKMAMRERGYEEWEQVRDEVAALVWIENIHGEPCREFGKDVMAGETPKSDTSSSSC